MWEIPQCLILLSHWKPFHLSLVPEKTNSVKWNETLTLLIPNDVQNITSYSKMLILMLTVLYISRRRTEVRYQTKGEGRSSHKPRKETRLKNEWIPAPAAKKNADQRLEIAFELLTFPNQGTNDKCQHLGHTRDAKTRNWGTMSLKMKLWAYCSIRIGGFY